MKKPRVLEVVCVTFVFCAATAIASPAQILTTLHSFSGTPDGANPEAGLIQATDGNFYGTTYQGGAYGGNCFGVGCGAVFKVTPSGTLTTLYSFDYTDGAYPHAGLIQASDGVSMGQQDTARPTARARCSKSLPAEH